jgi:hypothetical protein
MATEEKDYTEAPTSRLGANTVSASRALDAQRRANSAQRQGMALERTMQRKYRRAVRNNDLQAISTYGGQLDKMQISKFGGGGIQSAEENDLQAARRAERAREIGNQVGKETDRLTGRNNTVGGDSASRTDSGLGAPDGEAGLKELERAEPNSQAEADALASDAAKERQKIFGGSFVTPRNKFFSDLENSESIKSGNPEAIGAAAEAGKKFGITRDQIEAFSPGLIKERERRIKEKADEESAFDALAKASDKNETLRMSEKLKGVNEAFMKNPAFANEDLFDFSNTEKRGKAIADKKQAAEDQKDIKVQLEQSRNKTALLLDKAKERSESFSSERKQIEKDFKDYEYWSAPEEDVLNKIKYVGRSGVLDKSDPRFKAYDLRRSVINDFDSSKINVYYPQQGRTLKLNESATKLARKDALQSSMIERAISNNVDISGFANLDPDFKIKYEKALGEKREIEEEKKAADEFASVDIN